MQDVQQKKDTVQQQKERVKESASELLVRWTTSAKV